MTWEIATVLALVVFALVQFVRERWPTDLTGLVVFAILLLLSQIPGDHSHPRAPQLFKIFANAAPLAVAAMFVLTYALERTGAMLIIPLVWPFHPQRAPSQRFPARRARPPAGPRAKTGARQ